MEKKYVLHVDSGSWYCGDGCCSEHWQDASLSTLDGTLVYELDYLEVWMKAGDILERFTDYLKTPVTLENTIVPDPEDS